AVRGTWQMLAEQLADTFLVPWVRIRMQEADRHRFDVAAFQLLDFGEHVIFVERCYWRAIGGEALTDFEAQRRWDQWPGSCPVWIKLTARVSATVSDFERVTESF